MAPAIPLLILVLVLIPVFSPIHFRWRGITYHGRGGFASGVAATMLQPGSHTTRSYNWVTQAGFDPNRCEVATLQWMRIGPFYYLLQHSEQMNRRYPGPITPELKRRLVQAPAANSAGKPASPAR
jgi:hypothetical protein